MEGASVMRAEHSPRVRTGEVIGQVRARIVCDTALDVASHVVHKEEVEE